MLIALFGESCTGKSTLAEELKTAIGAEVYSGRDYLRLAKNGETAKGLFRELLRTAVAGENLVYVISEPEQMELLPDGAARVLVTADLDTIKARFAKRTGGRLPPPVAAMLERKHGCFDSFPHDLHIRSGQESPGEACRRILEAARG